MTPIEWMEEHRKLFPRSWNGTWACAPTEENKEIEEHYKKGKQILEEAINADTMFSW